MKKPEPRSWTVARIELETGNPYWEIYTSLGNARISYFKSSHDEAHALCEALNKTS